MRVKIADLRQVQKADITIDGVTLICGANEAGKSSICMAVASLLTGNPVPWPGVSKKDARQLVRDGVETAEISITGDDFKIATRLPKGEVTTEGNPPKMSDYAAGLATLAGKAPKEISPVLLTMIKDRPTLADLTADLEQRGVSPKNIEMIWEKIGEAGWDGVWSEMKERAPKAKGQWEEVTGEAWGSAKGEKWTPEGWQEGLQDQTVEALQAIVENSKAALNTTIGDRAVKAERRRALTETASTAATRKEALDAARNIETTCKIKLENAQAALAKLPADEANIMPMECPHCAEPFGIEVVESRNDQGVVFKREYKMHKHVGKATPGANADARKAHTAAQTEIERCQTNLAAATRQVGLEEGRLKEATDAAEALKGLPEGDAAQDTPEITKAREAVTRDQLQLDLCTKYKRAQQLHRHIMTVLAVIEATKPEGVRLAVLSRGIEKFNADHLAPLCALTGSKSRKAWPTVRFEADFTITYGGRLYQLCSASAQWKVRAILAIALARADGSALAVLDGADILDTEGQHGLISLASRLDIPTLIGMTGNYSDVPDLSRLKGGKSITYWVSEGIALPIHKTKAAA